MRRMRRRRNRGTWLPTFGNDLSGTQFFVGGTEIGLPLVAGQIVTGLYPLTFDYPKEPDEAGEADNSMADIIGSEYILRRIVGKFLVCREFEAAGTADDDPAIMVTAGFFVARAGESPNQDAPIGVAGATQSEVARNYSPLSGSTLREPWIWRRTWILGSYGVNGITTYSFHQARYFPPTNTQYGSVSDGAHIDAKTIRRVGNDNRLFLAVSATPWPIGNVVADPPVAVNARLDYRLFGSLRKARNQGAF